MLASFLQHAKDNVPNKWLFVTSFWLSGRGSGNGSFYLAAVAALSVATSLKMGSSLD